MIPKRFYNLILLFLITLPTLGFSHQNLESRIYGEVIPFTLMERSGKELSLENLKGNFWVANFIFTRCQGPCPLLTQNMKILEKELPKETQVVTFTVDPEYDSPQVLADYAKEFSIDRKNWYFLTGRKEKVYELIRSGFKIGVEENPEGKNITEQFIHSTYFVLVDGEGKIRGYFDGNDKNTLKQIPLAIRVAKIQNKNPWVIKLPALNAALNLTCAFLLLIGFQLVRAKKIVLHRIVMTTAFFISSLFLTSYLTYHYYLGSVPFLHEGWIRSFYFMILISHTTLAIAVLPLALLTLNYAMKGNFIKHKKIAHWTFPIWLYVSISGVAVYYMLYQL